MCQIQQKPRSYCGKNRNDKKNWDLHRLFQYFMSEPIEAIEKKGKKEGEKRKKGRHGSLQLQSSPAQLRSGVFKHQRNESF